MATFAADLYTTIKLMGATTHNSYASKPATIVARIANKADFKTISLDIPDFDTMAGMLKVTNKEPTDSRRISYANHSYFKVWGYFTNHYHVKQTDFKSMADIEVADSFATNSKPELVAAN